MARRGKEQSRQDRKRKKLEEAGVKDASMEEAPASTAPKKRRRTPTHRKKTEPACESGRTRRSRPEVDGPMECERARRLPRGSPAELEGGDVTGGAVTSEHTGVCWDKKRKKWRAQKMVKGERVNLGYYADEEGAARAVAEYVERGVVARLGRRGGTSEHAGVSWNKAAKKWVAQKWDQGKIVHLGHYADEEGAARAVAEYVKCGIVDPPGRGGVKPEHTGMSWDEAVKMWEAKKTDNGNLVYLGYYTDEGDVAWAVAEYVERGVVDPPERVGVTSQHTGVSWNKSLQKWKAQKRDKGKTVYLGYYMDEEDAARAVAEYVERGIVPRSR